MRVFTPKELKPLADSEEGIALSKELSRAITDLVVDFWGRKRSDDRMDNAATIAALVIALQATMGGLGPRERAAVAHKVGASLFSAPTLADKEVAYLTLKEEPWRPAPSP